MIQRTILALRRAIGVAMRPIAEPRGADRDYGRAVGLADAARDARQWAAAADHYDAALALRGDDAAIWVQLGNVAKEAKDYPRSRRAYETALSLAPNAADTHIQLGHLLKLLGEADKALENYRRALQADPHNADATRELRALEANPRLARPGLRRPSAGRPGRQSLNARLAAARTTLDDLSQAGSDNPAFGRGQDALRAAKPALAEAVHALDGVLKALNGLAATADRSGAAAALEIVFDVSDLVEYFQQHRLPSGIQRVQIEVISVAILKASPAVRVRVCCFAESDDYWREVPPADFLNLCELSLLDRDWTAPEWVEPVAALGEAMRAAPDLVFGRGAFLVNIGTSWALPNYFLHVREAKRRDAVRYVPFVHDMIPIVASEYCVEGLVQDFIGWAQGVYLHADYFFVNSQSTRGDLVRVAAALGHVIDESRIHTVRLDADFRKPDALVRTTGSVLDEARLVAGRYVLFVSTVEARKNHAALFDAWLRLIRQHGAGAVPKLVCVGARGWMNDAVFARLEASRLLRESVVMLTGVSDVDLATLYRNCLFSVYPSFYEGWGLPVTEALCYGKTVLVSHSSSLPEAGGPFVDAFDLGSETSLDAGLSALIFDAAHRAAKEASISETFRARRWDVIADEVEGALAAWNALPPQKPGYAEPVERGRYYPLARNGALLVTSGVRSGEMFRRGDGWWGPNGWGCWLKPGAARLEFSVGGGPGAYRCYVGLRGVPEADTAFEAGQVGGPMARDLVKAGRDRWVVVEVVVEVAEPSVTLVLQGYAQHAEKQREDREAVPVTLGVLGFMVCRADDAASRNRLTEAVMLDRLDELARPPACPERG